MILSLWLVQLFAYIAVGFVAVVIVDDAPTPGSVVAIGLLWPAIFILWVILILCPPLRRRIDQVVNNIKRGA